MRPKDLVPERAAASKRPSARFGGWVSGDKHEERTIGTGILGTRWALDSLQLCLFLNLRRRLLLALLELLELLEELLVLPAEFYELLAGCLWRAGCVDRLLGFGSAGGLGLLGGVVRGASGRELAASLRHFFVRVFRKIFFLCAQVDDCDCSRAQLLDAAVSRPFSSSDAGRKANGHAPSAVACLRRSPCARWAWPSPRCCFARPA